MLLSREESFWKKKKRRKARRKEEGKRKKIERKYKTLDIEEYTKLNNYE